MTRNSPAVRRFLTLLFADLNQSTRFGAQLEAETYAALVERLHLAYRQTVGAHGGTVVRIQGDGMLAIFGHPEALEDDGRRAIDAALELHQAVRSIGAEPDWRHMGTLTLHSGIHSGLVLLSPGDLERGRFELMGNAANIAARLADAAVADEILVSEESLGAADRDVFVTERLRSMPLRGAAPMQVLSVTGRATDKARERSRAMRARTPFAGRQVELAELARGLVRACTGAAVKLAIVGPAGLGKSRLLDEFLPRCAADGHRILRGACEQYGGGGRPLEPFLHVLRALAEPSAADGPADAALAERAAAALRSVAAVAAAPSPGRHHLPEAIRDVLRLAAGSRTLVLALDDWQLADDASRQVLRLLHETRGIALLALVATRVPEEATPGERDERLVEVGPLDGSDATQTVQRLLPRANPFVVADVCAASGGNPLYIEELCHRARHAEAGHLTEGLAAGVAWLRLAIESRVMRLEETQAALVRTAAVIGTVIPDWLFESVTGTSIDDGHVRALSDLDLVFVGERAGTLRFKHGLTRDAVYEGVGLHQRRAMHVEIAQAIESHRPAEADSDMTEALAYHWSAGGRPAEAARHAEDAGDRASAVFALDRAQTQYRAALAALDQLEPVPAIVRRWISVLQRLGMACVFDPTRQDLRLFERGVFLALQASDRAAIAAARFWLAYIHYALGDAARAVLIAREALVEALAAGQDKLAVQVEATLGQALAADCRYDEALQRLDASIAVKRRHLSGSGLGIGLAYSLACKAYVLGDRGDFDAAHAAFAEARGLLRGTDHQVAASIHGWQSAVLLWQGRWAEALGAANEARRIGEQVRSLFTLSVGRAVAAFASWMLDASDESLVEMEVAAAWLAPRGNELFMSLVHGRLAEANMRAGNVRAARAAAARAGARARAGDLLGAAMASRAMALLAVAEPGHPLRSTAAGREARALRWLRRAERVAEARQSRHERACNLLCHAEVQARLGQVAAAAATAATARAAFEACDMAWHTARADALGGASAPSARG